MRSTTPIHDASDLSRELRAFLPDIVAGEVLAAHAGLKVARTGLKRSNMLRLAELGRRAGFHVHVGIDECYPRRDKAKGGWCNGSREGKVRGPGYLNVYVGQSPRLTRQARDAEAAGDDATFARILGTPPCCRAFYDRVKDEAALEQNDIVPFCAPRSPAEKTSAFLNLGAQYFDSALISHFPCSLSCQHSIALARERARLLLQHDPTWLKQIVALLNHATLYTEYLGIYLLGAAQKIDDERLRFDRRSVRGTSRSRIFRALAQGGSVGLQSDGSLEIGSDTGQWTFRPTNVRLFLPTPITLRDL